MREALQLVLQQLIELEAEQKMGAGKYERTAERTTQRNGYRDRALPIERADETASPNSTL